MNDSINQNQEWVNGKYLILDTKLLFISQEIIKIAFVVGHQEL